MSLLQNDNAIRMCTTSFNNGETTPQLFLSNRPENHQFSISKIFFIFFFLFNGKFKSQFLCIQFPYFN